MKITDFALVFMGIMLPVVIVVYINVSYTIMATEQESYYTRIINAAVNDATYAMKEVENEDAQIDYGYSGVTDNKVSVNAQVAVDTFLKSIYKNFQIEGNESLERYVQLFIPAIAIVDYDGVQVSSIEEYSKNGTNVMEHVLKPKRYFSYTFALQPSQYVEDGKTPYEIISDKDTIEKIKNDTNVWIYNVEFTMDDRVTVRTNAKIQDLSTFYLDDDVNNSIFIPSYTKNANILLPKIISHLKEVRSQVIANTITDEMSYAINKNNTYAAAAGINYTFSFPVVNQTEWQNNVSNIGMIAFVQGISIGNKYLNYNAYGITDLTLANRYYLSVPNITSSGSNGSKYKYNLYHKSRSCPEYLSSKSVKLPTYAVSKQEAASTTATLDDGKKTYGFMPCPICFP